MESYALIKTNQFDRWFRKLDKNTQMRIALRLRTASLNGHLGDHHGVGNGVSEMRLDFGPGYRLYYTVFEYRGAVLLLLLGGDKSGQQKDIDRAKVLLPAARAWAEQQLEEERYG